VGGYNFTLSWRQTLPIVIKAGLGLYNFQTGQNALLSYKTTLFSFGISSGIVNIDLIGGEARMVYMAYSVIIVTEENSYF
jgi:hypothetical protein